VDSLAQFDGTAASGSELLDSERKTKMYCSLYIKPMTIRYNKNSTPKSCQDLETMIKMSIFPSTREFGGLALSRWHLQQ
jgi:hypothetical protein